MAENDAEPVHWVFLRGLARENAHWDDFPERFVVAMPQARVHLLDLPGNGQLWRMDSPLAMESMMELVRSSFRERVKETADGVKVYLFAMSLGAMVSVAWAKRYPQEIAGAVLVNTSLGGLSPFYRRLHWRSWPLLMRIGAAREPARREHLILHLTARLQQPTGPFIQSRVQAYLRYPVRGRNVLRQLWSAARFRPPSSAPAVPLLLLNSLGDRMVDPQCSSILARQWGAELHTHPLAGHDLPLDDADWTVARIKAWWLQLAAVKRTA